MMPKRASAYRTWDGGIAISAPWLPGRTPELVDLLKAIIPAHARRYDAGTKVWTVGGAWADTAVSLLLEVFPDADVTRAGCDSRPPVPPCRPSRDRTYAALHLLPTAPPQVIEAAYRALCKLYHPDLRPEEERGLVTARMAEINRAVEALRLEGAA